MRKSAFASLIVATAIGIAWAASGDWSAARSKVDDMKSKQMELRKLTPDETRKIVTAIWRTSERRLVKTLPSASRGQSTSLTSCATYGTRVTVFSTT